MTDRTSTIEVLTPAQISDLIADLKALVQNPADTARISLRAKLDALIAAIDGKLSEQIKHILHHADFAQLERAWRGLHYLVSHSDTNNMLKIKVLSMSKAELHESLTNPEDKDWEHNPLFEKIYREVYDIAGAEPFACLVGDYYFSHATQDVTILERLSKICALSHTVFLGGADPSLMGLDSWQQLDQSNDYLQNQFYTPTFEAWRRLRATDTARYIGLTMPRFLGRLPYGAVTNPVAEFYFEEAIDYYPRKHTWCNSAYLMAANINRAFALFGWCANIRGFEGGGAIEGLPAQSFPTDYGGVSMNCPLEISISERREAELSNSDRLRLMPLLQKKDTNFIVFIGVNSLHKPAEYDDPELTANANLASRFPYLLPACRFAQYLQCIARDNIDLYQNSQHMQQALQNWLQAYVDEYPYKYEKETTKPLAAAKIAIIEPEDKPYWIAECVTKPLYQIPLTAPIDLILRLPKPSKTQ